jgi:O-antigen/teichoic acid export membrane protein
VRAAGWTVLGHAASQVVRLGSNLVLTRLLAPESYGVMAVGYVVMTGLVMFSDIGLSSGAIHSRRGDDPHYLNVSWVVQIMRGVLITIVGMLLAGFLWMAGGSGWLPAKSVYADPQVPSLIAIVALFGIAQGFESTKSWLARRHLSLATVIKIDLSCQLASTIFIIGWALVSPSVWALAGGYVFSAAMKTVLTHIFLPGPSNKLEWDWGVFAEVFHFGKWVFLSSAISFLLTSGDRLILGALLDSREMGYYSIALLLIGAVQTVVNRVVGYAVLPALGEVARERPSELRATIYRIRRPLDAVCLVSAGALLMLGRPIVDLLYDPRYMPAGAMLSILSLTLVATRLDVFDQCLVALGRVKRLSMLNAVRLVLLYTLIPTGFHLYGLNGALAAVVASSMISAIMVLTVQGRLGLLDLRRELLAVPLFGAGVAAGWLLAFLLRLAH